MRLTGIGLPETMEEATAFNMIVIITDSAKRERDVDSNNLIACEISDIIESGIIECSFIPSEGCIDPESPGCSILEDESGTYIAVLFYGYDFLESFGDNLDNFVNSDIELVGTSKKAGPNIRIFAFGGTFGSLETTSVSPVLKTEMIVQTTK
ncbi:MAG: hypothetical protein COA94_07780 [Rickettsiales bacterium]|nr:MAG: hypothetical protein COA94_07780 [Rickettsiales bacterium]